MFWRAQFIPLLRSQGLQGFIDGSYPCPPERVPVPTEGGRMALALNPEHHAWVKQDQAILSAIVGSLTPSVSRLVLFATTAFDAWTTLNTSFGSQSSARAMQLRNKLGQMKKHDLTAHAYFNQVKMAVDTLASIGQPLCDSEFTGFVLNGLDTEYDGLIEAVEGRDTPISERDLYSHLMSTEQRIDSRRAADTYGTYSDVSANAVSCGGQHRGNRGGPPGGGAPPAPRPPQQPAPRGQQPPPPPAPNNGSGGRNGRQRPVCQLCGILGHIASLCFKRFNREFLGVSNDGANTER
jgi:hypothetical protein